MPALLAAGASALLAAIACLLEAVPPCGVLSSDAAAASGPVPCVSGSMPLGGSAAVTTSSGGAAAAWLPAGSEADFRELSAVTLELLTRLLPSAALSCEREVRAAEGRGFTRCALRVVHSPAFVFLVECINSVKCNSLGTA